MPGDSALGVSYCCDHTDPTLLTNQDCENKCPPSGPGVGEVGRGGGGGTGGPKMLSHIDNQDKQRNEKSEKT